MLKSGITWLSLEERNTSFFHKNALFKRRSNRIYQIRLNDNSWVSSHAEIAREIKSNLMNTFCTLPLIVLPDPTILQLLPKLSYKENLLLTSFPNIQEIKDALWSIHPYKTPRDDGLHAIFYQKNWDLTQQKNFKNSIISSLPGRCQALGVIPPSLSYQRMTTLLLLTTIDH